MHALDSGRLAPCAASVSMACEPDASTPIGLAGGAPRRHASNLAVDEFDYTGRRFRHGAVLLWLLVKKVQCLADYGLNSLSLERGTQKTRNDDPRFCDPGVYASPSPCSWAHPCVTAFDKPLHGW